MERNNILVLSTNKKCVLFQTCKCSIYSKIFLKSVSHLICSGVPPDVALVIAQAASFLVRNSAF